MVVLVLVHCWYTYWERADFVGTLRNRPPAKITYYCRYLLVVAEKRRAALFFHRCRTCAPVVDDREITWLLVHNVPKPVGALWIKYASRDAGARIQFGLLVVVAVDAEHRTMHGP